MRFPANGTHLMPLIRRRNRLPSHQSAPGEKLGVWRLAQGHFDTPMGGDMAQEVRAVVWQSVGSPVRSHQGVSKCPLSKTPNPQLLLTSWLVPCMAANRRECVCVCVNG